MSINLEDGAEIRTLSTLKGLESTLPSPPFLRVQRSFVVNLDKVKVLERNGIVFGKKLIPVFETGRDEVLQCFEAK